MAEYFKKIVIWSHWLIKRYDKNIVLLKKNLAYRGSFFPFSFLVLHKGLTLQRYPQV